MLPRSLDKCLFLSILMVSGCAQVSAPTGGKKDTIPPSVLRSNPRNSSINFKQKEISVLFDEWIQPLQNPKNQVIITPSVEPFPKITAARNELNIRFKDTLNSNTTYSIFLGDNLKDNNEGNALRDFKFIFSTGSFIDSLVISGTVKTQMDKIPENTYLSVYKEKDDSAFLRKRPYYITKIEDNGSFELQNVKEGYYRIYAISDKNGNYFYDLPTEAIGFTDSFYHIATGLDSLSMELFMPEDSILRITEFDRIINGGVWHLTFNKELSFNKDEITVTALNDSNVKPIAFQLQYLNQAGKGSSVSVYLPRLNRDTGNISFVIADNGKLIDTLGARLESSKWKMPQLFFPDTAMYKTLSVYEDMPLKLVSSFYSLTDPDTSRIALIDTSLQSIQVAVNRSEDLHTYSVKAQWKPGMQYRLRFLDSALTDIVGNYNKKQEFLVTAISLKKLGNLLIEYKLPDEKRNYIAVLKDYSGKILDKRVLRDSQAVKVNYGLMAAGNYQVEVIDDVNGNGIWNSGNFVTKTLPEKIYKEPKPVVVKENWDAEENIDVNFEMHVPQTAPSEIPGDTNKKPRNILQGPNNDR
jgi:uncharacterized protein (DUF2141 family)